MKDNKIKYNGEIIDLDKLSNDEIIALRKDVSNQIKASIGKLKEICRNSKPNDDGKSR